MTTAATPDLSYPTGKFAAPAQYTPELREKFIADIAAAPKSIRAAVQGLNDRQLDTPYRPGGWTVRQTVHHMADSHMNAVARFKLALTEETPGIKAYDEKLWAELADAKLPIAASLAILDGVHERWVALLKEMKTEDFSREFMHPERGTVSLNNTLALYAWHGKHHVAHITALRHRNGW